MPLVQRKMREISNRAIPRSEFDRLLLHNTVLENLKVEQVEWFSNRSGSLLGTVAKGQRVAGWNYAILKRGKKGGFYVHKVMNNFFSSEDARVDLLLWMARSEKIARIDSLLSVVGREKIARIDSLLSVVGSEKSNCTNQPNLPVLLISPAPLEVVDRNSETTDIELAV